MPFEDLRKLEEAVQAHYDDSLQPVAGKLQVDLPRNRQAVPSLPMVLFLGNHSSGKSSFINHLIGAPRQKTGLAPTDDGFTVLAYGETEDEFDGQSAATHPEFAFGRLERLGSNFLSRMRLKTHPAEILRSMSLIDSPGMIDAAGTADGRGYNFAAGVRAYAEMSDLILFFFDPDKPGTTGETISIFTETLVGLEHKLLIVLNKVDLFSNIRDFARTYGTLCWNLSKTMQTKDVPHIFNMYLPGQSAASHEGGAERVPLGDFDVSRREVENEIRRAPARRADNLVSDLLYQARALHMHGQVAEALALADRNWRFRFALASVVAFLAGAAGLVLTRGHEDWMVPATWLAGGILLAALVAGTGFLFLRQWRTRVTTGPRLDWFFETCYEGDLRRQERADLRGRWEHVRPRLLTSISLLGVSGLPRGFVFRRQLRRLGRLIDNDIPKLRRTLPRRVEAPADTAPEATSTAS